MWIERVITLSDSGYTTTTVELAPAGRHYRSFSHSQGRMKPHHSPRTEAPGMAPLPPERVLEDSPQPVLVADRNDGDQNTSAMKGPGEQRLRGGYMRTAICVTGLPRALVAKLGEETFFDDYGMPRSSRHMVHTDWAWAGPRRLPYPDNFVANAFRNHVLDVLAHEGVDVFVLQHGKIDAGNGILVNVSYEPRSTNGGYDALRPNTVNNDGSENRLIMLSSKLNGRVAYNRTDRRWDMYFYSYAWPRRRAGLSRENRDSQIQSLLISNFHMSECNAHVKRYVTGLNSP